MMIDLLFGFFGGGGGADRHHYREFGSRFTCT